MIQSISNPLNRPGLLTRRRFVPPCDGIQAQMAANELSISIAVLVPNASSLRGNCDRVPGRSDQQHCRKITVSEPRPLLKRCTLWSNSRVSAKRNEKKNCTAPKKSAPAPNCTTSTCHDDPVDVICSSMPLSV